MKMLGKDDDRITSALEFARRYGNTDGEHHKMWVIDQMVRCLTEDDYDLWVRHVKAGADGPETYVWDVGVAP